MIGLGKAALGIGGVALSIYLVFVAGLFFFQRSLLYPAPRAEIARSHAGFEKIRLTTSDGLILRAFYRPARAGLPTLLFFHGNASDIAGGALATRHLAAQGYGVLLPEYRGYGGNPGKPSEQGLYLDGEAAMAWLAAHGVPASRVVVIGNSLGAGVATEVAARHRTAGLVLISGFSSLGHVAHEHYPFVPAALVRDRYDNLAKVPSIGSPILLLHGTADKVVSVRSSQALAAAQPRAKLELVPGVGHELAYLDIAQMRVLAWLRSL